MGFTILPINNAEYSWLLTSEIEKSLIFTGHNKVLSDSETIYKAGTELNIWNTLLLRTGYVYDFPGKIEGWTFGGGIAWSGISFDYASIPQAEGLDRVSRFSLTADVDKVIEMVNK